MHTAAAPFYFQVSLFVSCDHELQKSQLSSDERTTRSYSNFLSFVLLPYEYGLIPRDKRTCVFNIFLLHL